MNPLRHCLVDPIPEMDVAASLLENAADALVAGNNELARALLCEANMPVLHARGHAIMNKMPVEFERARRLAGGVAQVRASGRSPLPRPTVSEENAIYERDGHRCRYCGCRIVLKTVRSILTGIFPEAVPWPSKDQGKHGAFYALNGCIDHVVPHARGGENSPANLVVACWPCNNGKEAYSLEELGLSDPRDREPVVDDWDGLSRILKFRRESARFYATPTKTTLKMPTRTNGPIRESMNLHANHNAQWFASLDQVKIGTSARLRALVNELEAVGVRWTLNKTLLAFLHVNGVEIALFGIEPDGEVEIPWMIADQKAAYKIFAMTLAQEISGAVVYETPKMWRVKGPLGRIQLNDLLDAASGVIAGVKALAAI